MSEHTVEISEASFDLDVLSADTPVLVDFWAPWCSPCKMIVPILEQVGKELADTLKVCKINVDDHPNIASRYNVRGIPTMLLFKNGDLVGTKVGAATRSDLMAFIADNT